MPSTATTSPARAAVAQCVERGDARAKKRGGIDVGEIVGDARQRFLRRNHVFRVAAVVAEAWDERLLAKHEVAVTAMRAVAAMPAVPAHADALPLLPALHTRAAPFDHARDLMSRYARKLQSRPKTFLRERIAVADTAGLHLDQHVSFGRLRHIALDDFQRAVRLRHLHCLHLCHRLLLSNERDARETALRQASRAGVPAFNIARRRFRGWWPRR